MTDDIRTKTTLRGQLGRFASLVRLVRTGRLVRMGRLVSWALGAVLLAGVWAPAWAHASLTGSTPTSGQRLDALPERATLTFSEEITAPAYVVVTAPDGSRITDATAQVDGKEVTAPLHDTDQEGTYALAFRVVSADGHPVSGRLLFVVGDGPLEDGGPLASPSESGASDDTAGTGNTSEAGSSGDGESAIAGQPSSSDLSLGQVQLIVALALFGGAGVLYLLSRRRTD